MAFPGSTGAPFISHAVADVVAAPPEGARWFSERLVLLPPSYFVTDYRPVPVRPERVAVREGRGYVFGALDKYHKLSPQR